MSMAVGGKKGGAIADINVTPMADIMIVLLIIFMVITPMLQKGVDVKLPVASNTQGAQGRAEVDHGGGQNDATFTHLHERPQVRQPRGHDRAALRESSEAFDEGDKMVFLKADDRPARTPEVMKVMDILRESGRRADRTHRRASASRS